jgi:hypothetical protein
MLAIKDKFNEVTTIGTINVSGMYTAECFDADGNLKWSNDFHNIIVSEGLKYINDSFFSGSNYTAVWELGLVAGPSTMNTYNATDTIFSSINRRWRYFDTGDSKNNKKMVSFNTATMQTPSVISLVSPVSFPIINSGGTIAGACLIASGNSLTGSVGLLFSVGNFTNGDKIVGLGDTVFVTYTYSVATP